MFILRKSVRSLVVQLCLLAFRFLECTSTAPHTAHASFLFSTVNLFLFKEKVLEFGLLAFGLGPVRQRFVRERVGRVSLRKSRFGRDSPMKFNRKYWKLPAVFVCSLFLLPAVTQAQHYKQTNLVSDITGMAPTIDPNLKNPWGLTRSSGSPWWVANNNSGTSTLYDGTGNPFPPKQTGGPLIVTLPPPRFSPGTPSVPRCVA